MAIKSPTGDYHQIINMTSFADATHNISPSFNAESDWITFSFNRLDSQSDILILGITTQRGTTNSDRCGAHIEVNGVKKFDGAFQCSWPGQAGTDHGSGAMRYNQLFTASELGTTTGSITVNLGHTSRDGSAQGWAYYINPRQNSSRAQENTTQLIIIESLGSIPKIT